MVVLFLSVLFTRSRFDPLLFILDTCLVYNHILEKLIPALLFFIGIYIPVLEPNTEKGLIYKIGLEPPTYHFISSKLHKDKSIFHVNRDSV